MSNTGKFKKNQEERLICPHCGKPMESISQTFYEIDRWNFNKKTKNYEKIPTNGSTEQFKCDRCGAEIGWDIAKLLED